ncbi:hypothetical protein NDU88_002982 [Pleurodeles waltl]|uniref:Uncharacterized protein n=1 Tax=Pleurodeles waltl TaxID=8319 RepID=A0AAV7TM44_PLEWA|nr:hypothetical protein NDU88_002982 [Pleurodeles waltl]
MGVPRCCTDVSGQQGGSQSNGHPLQGLRFQLRCPALSEGLPPLRKEEVAWPQQSTVLRRAKGAGSRTETAYFGAPPSRVYS